jgi:hypothetical protein
MGITRKTGGNRNSKSIQNTCGARTQPPSNTILISELTLNIKQFIFVLYAYLCFFFVVIMR